MQALRAFQSALSVASTGNKLIQVAGGAKSVRKHKNALVATIAVVALLVVVDYARSDRR